ncbi:MAG: hypothetical protein N3A02_07095, partial [Rectinema sp.]|nr:hypothetical protein [Rectinema sp.]
EYAYSSDSIAANIKRGQIAMEKVIREKTDVLNAMYRPELGGISFYWGTPGRGKKFKGGSGVSHIIAKRNSEGKNGEEIARNLVEVIAKGKISEPYGPPEWERVNVYHNGHTAVLSLYKDGHIQTWLLTGWKNDKEDSGVPGEGNDSTGTTRADPSLTRTGAGAESSIDNSIPKPGELFQSKNSPKGSIHWNEEGRAVITLFETADPSTLIHEMVGHYFMQNLIEMGAKEDAPDWMKRDR